MEKKCEMKKKEKIDKRTFILEANMFYVLLKISIPLMLSSFIFSAYSFIDGILVAQIGKSELAAVTMIGPFFNIILAISMGLTVGGTTIIGQSVGRGKSEEVFHSIIHLFFVTVFMGIVLATFLIIFSEPVLRFSSATDSIIEVGNDYFKILLLSIPLSFVNGSYIAYKSGLGATSTVLKVNLISVIVKVAFSYCFIIIFKKGIIFLAYATFLGQIVITLLALMEVYVNRREILNAIHLAYFNNNIIKNLFKVSIPIIIEKSSMSYSFVLINGFVIKYGETVLAAYGSTNRINSLFFTALSGLGSGVATIVSQNIGNNNQKRALKCFKNAMFLNLTIATIFAISIILFRSSFAKMFAGNDRELFENILDAISVYSVSVIPWGIFQIVIGYFTGIGKTHINLLITFSRLYAFRVPCIIFFSHLAFMGAYSVWFAMLLSNILTAIFALILFFIMKKRAAFDVSTII